MYSAFLFEAKNRKREVYCLTIVLDANMKVVFCKRHGQPHSKILHENGFKKAKTPFGIIHIPVKDLWDMDKKIMSKLVRKLGGTL